MMNFFEKTYLQYTRIKECLMDEESKKLFDARIEYSLKQDWESVEDIFFDRTKHWRCKEVDRFLQRFSSKKDIVLFGAGNVGKKTKEYLNACGYFPCCFCDNYVVEKEVNGLPVISVDEFMNGYDDSIIIICSWICGGEMYHQLIEKGCCPERILLPGGNRIQIHCDKQYFDIFSSKSEELFIDAGSFDGSTINDFFSWMGTNKVNGKCYSLEPVPEMYKKIVERSKHEKWKNVKICNCAAWDKEEDIFLTKDQKVNGVIWGGSCVGETGQVKVRGRAIDNICVDEERITFIKMDIEGSELKALKGAKNIIRRDKPKLAISIYHKPWDVFDIPYYILELVPEYKMYIRHYSADFTETVLYAEI